MADQTVKGDDEIKNSAAAAADDVGSKALENLQNEVAAELAKGALSALNDSAKKQGVDTASGAGSVADGLLNKLAKEGANRQNESKPGESGSIAEGILNSLGKDGSKKAPPANDGSAASGIAEAIINELNSDASKKPSANSQHSGSSESGALSDLIKNRIENSHPDDKIQNGHDALKALFGKADGVSKLSTGDFLVREDGRETLFTPKGDRVTVNPDGTHTIKGDVKSVKSDKLGQTTVTFGDGSTVMFDKEGILEVSRGKETVSFARLQNRIDKLPPIDRYPHPYPPIDRLPPVDKFPPIDRNPHPPIDKNPRPPIDKLPPVDRYPHEQGDKVPRQIPPSERYKEDRNGTLEQQNRMKKSENLLPNIEIKKN
ncbi:MAG: hypothetical protein K2X27_21500 [Candidatus Obscuribacterales bacterium]|nr:hypothetical protein [Candidatus Obscuribacterales bacterium]